MNYTEAGSRSYERGQEVEKDVSKLSMEEVNAILDRLQEMEASFDAHEAIGIYGALRDETDAQVIVDFMEKYESIKGHSDKFKAAGVDVALGRLCSLKEDAAVLKKLQEIDSFEDRNLVSVMSYCIRAKDNSQWLELLNSRYDDFTPQMKHCVMVNLMRVYDDPEINEFLLEHILDLNS